METIFKGMKLAESFKDLKGLLSLAKLMNKRREQMEKMVALVLLAYASGRGLPQACLPPCPILGPEVS